MRLLILGRDGQLGTALTKTLAPLGEIVAFGRDGADLARPERLIALVRREQPDVIVNAAAYTLVDKAESEPDLAHLVNAEAPATLARVAAETGSWLIHYSTDYVFDGEKDAPYGEEDSTAPLNVYGTTKRDGELAISKVGGEHLILRTSWMHAPGQDNFIARILRLAQSRDELKVVDDQIGAPTSATLIAEVTSRAIVQIDQGHPLNSGIYHLTSTGATSRNGYARFVVSEALRRGATLRVRRPERVLEVPSTALPSPARRPRNSCLSTYKVCDALGIDLPDWKMDVQGTLNTLLPESTQ